MTPMKIFLSHASADKPLVDAMRLSPANRQRARVLGVFHGELDLDLLRVMMDWNAADVAGLGLELVRTGLATPASYNHLRLNPALVSAHRGGPQQNLPENCLATFENTLRHTFAVLEVDPRYTKDGAIVLHHDARLERTTTGRGLVADFTLQELKQLRLKDPRSAPPTRREARGVSRRERSRPRTYRRLAARSRAGSSGQLTLAASGGRVGGSFARHDSYGRGFFTRRRE